MVNKALSIENHYKCRECGKGSRSPILYNNGCKKCLRDCPDVYAETMYSRMRRRQNHRFGSDLSFSLSEFREWLAKQRHYKTLFSEYLRVRAKNGNATGHAPCVDRIENWRGYTLDNIQLLSHSENSEKRECVGLGAKDKTMRFFKRLRDKLGLTKYEMANHLGMLPPTYYYYEDKAKGCSFEVLTMIRKKLGLSWQEIGTYIDDEYGEDEREEVLATRRKTKKKEKVD